MSLDMWVFRLAVRPGISHLGIPDDECIRHIVIALS